LSDHLGESHGVSEPVVPQQSEKNVEAQRYRQHQ